MEKRYDRRVFINCPFDAQYKPLFEAIVFAVRDCRHLLEKKLHDAVLLARARLEALPNARPSRRSRAAQRRLARPPDPIPDASARPESPEEKEGRRQEEENRRWWQRMFGDIGPDLHLR